MRLVRGPRFWLIAFALSFALWLVHDDSLLLPEVLAGLGVAALAATATELARRQRVAGVALRLGELRHAWRLIPASVRDCGALTKAAFSQLVHAQPTRGRTIAFPFRHGGDDPGENGRRALAEGLGSFAPATIVVGVDPDGDKLIAHQLSGTPDASSLDPLGLA